DKGHCDVVGCPAHEWSAASNAYRNQTTLFHGLLYNCDDGQIRRYDFATHQWKVLPFSDGGNYELFNVNGHLYAANATLIFEISDTDQTFILASTRRLPPVSVLDREDLGTPILFEGSGHALRVSTKSKIFSRSTNDWSEVSALPSASSLMEVFQDGILFHTARPFGLYRLETGAQTPELCLEDKHHLSGVTETAPTLWSLGVDLELDRFSAAV